MGVCLSLVPHHNKSHEGRENIFWSYMFSQGLTLSREQSERLWTEGRKEAPHLEAYAVGHLLRQAVCSASTVSTSYLGCWRDYLLNEM